jgi:hypothetical protein
MPWKGVERKIGRAGGLKQRMGRQREWDRKYGKGQWAVGFIIDGRTFMVYPPGVRRGVFGVGVPPCCPIA